MNKENSKHTANTITVILMFIVALLSFYYLSTWFISLGSIIKLIVTYFAIDYLIYFAKTLFKYFNNEVDVNQKIFYEINQVKQPSNRTNNNNKQKQD